MGSDEILSFRLLYANSKFFAKYKVIIMTLCFAGYLVVEFLFGPVIDNLINFLTKNFK